MLLVAVGLTDHCSRCHSALERLQASPPAPQCACDYGHGGLPFDVCKASGRASIYLRSNTHCGTRFADHPSLFV
ncbi:hypothetical protein C8R48DRAFT_688967 [Suillus tomentosus]|nr:hypothetical protein C8R48DRAFT_688967 [Suillus tomentosus]